MGRAASWCRVGRMIPLAVAVVGAGADGAAAQEPPDPAFVDRVFAEYDRDGHPGCAMGVYGEGEVVFTRSYGEAHLDWNLPVTDSTVFYSGSVSKQFTAALAALLHLDGTLDLDGDVRAFLPELPPYDPPVTVRQLVHHTSGIRDVYGLIGLSGGRIADAWTDLEYLDLLARQRTLNHEPGSDRLYSNGGYFLLTTLLERASGRTLRELARERIFGPLGMEDTHFHQDAEHVVERRAMSYRGDADEGFRQTYLGNFDKAGAGGLYTTVRDLAAWDRNFSTGEVGGEAFLELITERAVLTTGDTLDYAFGLSHGTTRERPTIGHGGSFMGFRAHYVRFPEDGFALSALCNLGSADPGSLLSSVAEEMLAPGVARTGSPEGDGGADGAGPEGPAGEESGAPRTPPSAGLPSFAGTYRSSEVGHTLTVRWNEGGLRLLRDGDGDAAALEWHGGDVFEADGWTLEFDVRADEVTGLVLDAGRVRNLRFERVEP